MLKLKTIVVGQGALARHCLDALIAHGMTPALVASLDGSLTEACQERGVPHCSERAEVSRWVTEHGCDLLFSVRNPWILPAELLDRVQRLAVNFHDSLLPSYAGLHATSWALIHGEREHGISWHEVTPGIDRGRVLTQVRVPVEPTDTAFSLNTKCFAAAAESFDGVLADLEAGTETLTPQEGTYRYFSGRDRPEAQCTIDLRKPAQTTVDLVRALEFGHAENPLGMPKLWLGDRFVIVRRARVLDSASVEAPGVLLSVEEGVLRVASASVDLCLEGLSSLSGEPLAAEEVAAHVQAYVGRVLPSVAVDERAAITALNKKVCRFEGAWRRRLEAGVSPVEHPYAPVGAWGRLRPFALPKFNALLAAHDVSVSSQRCAAIVAGYCARLHAGRDHDLGVAVPSLEGVAREAFMPIVPLRLPNAAALSFGEFASEFNARWARVGTMYTFARDLVSRTPAVRGRARPRWPLAIACGVESVERVAGMAAMVIDCGSGGSSPQLWATEEINAEQRRSLDAQLTALAKVALHEPEHPVATLPLIDEAEHERMVVTWNATVRPIPKTGVHELFTQQAQRTPDAPAVRFGADALTYAALDARANQIARALRSREVGVGERVGLAVSRSVDLVAAMLGILKAGAAYVPIDHNLPSERVASIIERAQPVVLITDRKTRPTLEPHGRALLCVHEDGALISSQRAESLHVPTDPEAAAYVIFTSGSTGTPKAVEVLHRGVVNHALAVAVHYDFRAGDSMLLSASVAFDIAGEQIYPTLLQGAEVVVRPETLLDSFRGFDEFVRGERLSHLALPAAFWHEWVGYLVAHDLSVPPSLRTLGVGTEKVLGESLAQWRERETQSVRFIQGYGPTETTITSTMFVLDDRQFDVSRPLPIGRPLANTQIYLLDDAGQPAAVGMPGELCIGGLGLARGYVGQPNLTRECFVPHPFDEGARIYRTGDIARFRENGQIVFLGRRDSQVKIRGHRVELGEIEAVLRSHPLVDEAVAIVRDDAGAPKRLVAYVRGAASIDAEALAELCRARLPDPMVPAAFVTLERFPVNVNGKVDRAALPIPAAPRPTDGRALADETERRVAAQFAEVLGVATVSPGQGFFDLGGDSLRAMIVLDRLGAEFGVSLPLMRFFEHSTVEAVAESIRDGAAGGSGAEEAAIIQLKKGTGTPLYVILGVSRYEALTQALRCPNPVFAVVQPIESQMLRMGTTLPTVQVLARMNVELLLRHQPEGPYILGGYSFGGFVAYEMAQLLRRRGADVSALVLFDCMLPWGRTPGPVDVAKSLVRSVNAGHGRSLMRKFGRKVGYSVRARLGLEAPPPARPPTKHERLRAYRLGEYARCSDEYAMQMEPYEGRVVLFRSLAARKPLMPCHGFEKLVSPQRLITFDVPGSHDTLLDAGTVATIASHLDRLLGKHRPTQPSAPAAIQADCSSSAP